MYNRDTMQDILTQIKKAMVRDLGYDPLAHTKSAENKKAFKTAAVATVLLCLLLGTTK